MDRRRGPGNSIFREMAGGDGHRRVIRFVLLGQENTASRYGTDPYTADTIDESIVFQANCGDLVSYDERLQYPRPAGLSWTNK